MCRVCCSDEAQKPSDGTASSSEPSCAHQPDIVTNSVCSDVNASHPDVMKIQQLASLSAVDLETMNVLVNRLAEEVCTLSYITPS